MKTVFISGADTDVGKTYVTGALARRFAREGKSVAIIKPYQSGLAHPERDGDAALAKAFADHPRVAARTLRCFRAALGPLCAAQAEGADIELQDVLRALTVPEACDIRLVEGAGGLAVPLTPEGFDWADFARTLKADAVCLVVADRLGAIHQARVVYAYARAKGLNAGVILNACAPCPADVARSTRVRLAECGVPLWGELGFRAQNFDRLNMKALS